MLNATDQVRYKNRLAALINNQAIGGWKRKYKKVPVGLGDIISGFQTFSIDYFDYFLRNDGNTREVGSVLSKIQDEWEIIERACQQRDNPELEKQLGIADEIAKSYFDRFDGIEGNPPLVYFEKLYSITRFIFARSGFISIPFQLYNDPSQWQGLAHEMGHFVYWNVENISNFQSAHDKARISIQKIDSKRGMLWKKWYEEVFADIFGTLLAGPAYLDSALRRIVEAINNESELLIDDDIHPYPYLRPLISIETLKWVKDNYHLLDDERSYLESAITELETQYTKDIANKLANILGDDHKNARADVSKVVNEILNTTQDVNQPYKVKINLGNLIIRLDFTSWQGEHASRMELMAIRDIPEKITTEIGNLFKELETYLHKKINEVNEIKKKLLSLGLSDEGDIGECKNRTVKFVGANQGSYDRC